MAIHLVLLIALVPVRPFFVACRRNCATIKHVALPGKVSPTETTPPAAPAAAEAETHPTAKPMHNSAAPTHITWPLHAIYRSLQILPHKGGQLGPDTKLQRS